MQLIAKILLPLPFEEFDYKIPPNKDFEVGDFVEVPFRNKRLVGLITGFEEAKEEKFKLKYIIANLREKGFEIPTLSEEFLEFLNKQSAYYLQEKGSIFSLCFSDKYFKESKRKTKPKIKLKPKTPKNYELNEEQQRAYENILRRILGLTSPACGGGRICLESDSELSKSGGGVVQKPEVRIQKSEPHPPLNLPQQAGGETTQNSSLAMTSGDIVAPRASKADAVSNPSLRGGKADEAIHPNEQNPMECHPEIVASSNQSAIPRHKDGVTDSISLSITTNNSAVIPAQAGIKQIDKKIDTDFRRHDEQKQNFTVTLLDGVTGSGKTEVFFKLAEDIINEGKQVLIMLPEIFLTSQIVARFEARFADDVVIWHSAINDSKKKNYFFDIVNGRAKIVIGARSALQLPYKNLGIIICDEEHDTSYKQDEGIVYNARDMAVMRGKIENIPVILSSATPSIETLHNVLEKKYFVEKLTHRFSKTEMPLIDLIDMRIQKLKATEFISAALQAEIQKTLDEKKQVLLFLNRRGYSPLVICSACGHRIKSPDTSAWMALHFDKYKQPYLQCHHSGYRSAIPEHCPECKNTESFKACGPGVQRISEEVKNLFPQYRTLEMASDSMSSKKKADEFLEKIINNEVDIIIGTQIIAKGHHFPNLKTVGVIDADLGLDFTDLRAGEKTFQLLQQVSGRAGREGEQGRVFLQTYNPTHPVLVAIKNYDREGFEKYELQQRKSGNLPPFSKFTALIIYSQDEETAKKLAKDVASQLIQTKDVKIWGPAEAMFYELRGWYRHRLLLVCTKNYNIQNYLKKSLENLKLPKDSKLKIDIDPYNFS